MKNGGWRNQITDAGHQMSDAVRQRYLVPALVSRGRLTLQITNQSVFNSVGTDLRAVRL